MLFKLFLEFLLFVFECSVVIIVSLVGTALGCGIVFFWIYPGEEIALGLLACVVLALYFRAWYLITHAYCFKWEYSIRKFLRLP